LGQDTKTAEIRPFSNRRKTPLSLFRRCRIADHHLDIEEAVQGFLRNYESLVRLPLISDSEMSRLFGEGVASALAELGIFNQEEQLCLHCGGACCRLVRCELYLPEMGCCPLHQYRPVLCRMHFCTKYARTYPWLVKEIGDIYLESLITAEKAGCKTIPLFDCPPLKKAAPGMVELVSRSLAELREPGQYKELVLAKIENGIAGYRL
jgi:hypothetical protein